MSRFLLKTNANQMGAREMIDIVDIGSYPRCAYCMVHIDMFYDDKPICNKLRGGEEVEIEIKEVTE